MKNYDCPDTDVVLASRRERAEPPHGQDASSTRQAKCGRVWKSIDRRWFVFGAALLALVVGLLLHRRFFHDDAYISLRYGERLLAGKGLTWNDGERIEGFSSPLWLAQIVLLGLLGVPLALAAQVLGVLYALATVVLWVGTGKGTKANPAGLLVLVTIPGWALWALGGLETISACFWILMSLVLVWRMRDAPSSRTRGLVLGFSLAAVALSRPEGIAVGVTLLCAAAFVRRGRDLVLAAAPLVVLFGGYQIFRLAYFGDWIANAARAKAIDLPVGARLADAATYVIESAQQWLAAALVATWLIIWSPDRRRIWVLLLPCLPLLALVVVGGGDHMLGARFMLAPVAVLALAGSLAAPSPRGGVRATALVLVAVSALWQLQLSWRYPAARNPAAALGEFVGRVLEDRLPPGTLVAAATAGSLPYFAPSLSFIDTLGINDRHIARAVPAPMPRALSQPDGWFAVPGHRRGDGPYVLSRRPDLIMLGGAHGDIDPWFLGDFQLLMSERFRADYAPWRWLVPVPPSYQPWVVDQIDPETGRLPITFYVRRDSGVWPVVARQGEPLRPPWIADR